MDYPLPSQGGTSPSDTSLEANLTRVRFFRNELYGHASTTGVDTSTFSSLWQEISAVLVALGLDQAEIDRLKAEHCGEEDYLDVLLEWAEREEDITLQLTKTQQSIGEVRQTQLKNQKILEDSKLKLKEVLHTQITTQEALHKLQKEHRETLKQLKQTSEEQRTNDRADEILKKLAKTDAQKDVKYHAERYQEGTRMSIFRKVENWLDDRSSQNRVMVISGNAGMGKTVLSAFICTKMQLAGKLSGSHFCQHGKARHRNPKVMLQSLACQLSHCLPEYKSVIVEKLSRNLGGDLNSMEVSDLFDLLFEESLRSVADPGRNILIVIDGLDESGRKGRNELLDIIANHFCKLPFWIRLLVTTRPEINIADSLRVLKPLQLEPSDEENLQDIRLYFKERLNHVIQPEHQEIILDELVRKSEGVILFAYFLVDFLEKSNMSLLTPDLLNTSLPSGVSSVYKSYFKRLESELSDELSISKEQFFDFLCAVTAAREPLPVGFVSTLFESGGRSPVGQRTVNRAIACISALLPIQDGFIHFFHKSIKDWLTNTSVYGQHDFTVDEKEGHGILSDLCTSELDNLKCNGIDNAYFTDTTKYALQHGVQHILELRKATKADSLEEIVKKYVVDEELVYAKLCVSNTATAEDIVYVLKQEDFEALSENSQCALRVLLFLIRRHICDLTKLPHLFFQTMLNLGGPELSSEASQLLESKYPEIPCMEYMEKNRMQESVQARFYCSSQVACFDISPQKDYMVCEPVRNVIMKNHDLVMTIRHDKN